MQMCREVVTAEEVPKPLDSPPSELCQHLDYLEAKVIQLADSEEAAWVLIANANEGYWERAKPEWKAAAEKWRDKYHDTLDTPTSPDVIAPDPPGDPFTAGLIQGRREASYADYLTEALPPVIKQIAPEDIPLPVIVALEVMEMESADEGLRDAASGTIQGYFNTMTPRDAIPQPEPAAIATCGECGHWDLANAITKKASTMLIGACTCEAQSTIECRDTCINAECQDFTPKAEVAP
jgi:hypothetical protein